MVHKNIVHVYEGEARMNRVKWNLDWPIRWLLSSVLSRLHTNRKVSAARMLAWVKQKHGRLSGLEGLWTENEWCYTAVRFSF
jgi:hypothetical protein